MRLQRFALPSLPVTHRRKEAMPADDSSVQLTRAISREAVAALPIRRYEGDICLVESESDLARAQADLNAESVVGFDTETRPAFTRGVRHLPCLVQAATARAVYLFPLRWKPAFVSLAELLADTRICKVGISINEDLRVLAEVFPFGVANVREVGDLARRLGVGQSGLRNLAGLFLGFRIAKGKQTSNWAAARLSSAQIAYAATDARACRELYLHLRSMPLPQPVTVIGMQGGTTV